MPVVPVVTNLSSPPSNAFGLYQYMAQRIPGYDPSEYLRELNSAYIHVWEEITKLKNFYFTNVKQITTTLPGNTFDLLYNTNNALSTTLSNRLYQISRIRALPPQGNLFQATQSSSPTDPDFIALSANSTANPTQSGPYKWWLNGRGNVTFALPVAAGTVFEIAYSWWPVALTYLANGAVSQLGVVITGTGTTFTQLVQPDFLGDLPFTGGQQEMQAEFIVNTNQVTRVTAIASDTSLSVTTAPSPVLTNSPYVLATLPDIPREHIRVIASVALSKMFSVDGDDARVAEWTGIAASNMQMMKDSLIERQSNNPPTKQRFPYGVGRRNRAFLR